MQWSKTKIGATGTPFGDAPRRKWVDGVVLVLIGLLIAGACDVATRFVPFVKAGEALLADLRIAYLSPPQSNGAGIVVIGIDETTLGRLSHRSPIDRAFLADLIDHLVTAQVRAIGLDILFDQSTEPAEDARLRRALATAPVPVVAAWVGDGAAQTAEQRAFMAAFLDGVGKGEANLWTDQSFGIVRWSGPRSAAPADALPGFAAALAKTLGGEPPDRRFQIDYRPVGPKRSMTFPVYPAFAVPALPPAWLKDKIVLVGTTLPDQDRHRTPLSVDPALGAMHGIQIHAQILAHILENRHFPMVQSRYHFAILLAAAALGIVLVVVPLQLALKVAGAVALVLGYWFVAFAGFGEGLALLPLFAPSAAFAATLGAASAVVGRRQRAERRFIRRVFGQYVSPNVVDRLIADAAHFKLGGERRHMTFLFTDLAGFTALTEATPPEIFQPLLNRYLDGMISIALEHDGTIDKVVGDAVVVFFGAPADQPDHAECAVACGMAMDRFAGEFAAQRTAEGIPLGLTRIGIHSGEATIGNFGGSQFFDYTAHGDTVNTAARLESANKHFGTRLCVSEATINQAAPRPHREIGAVVLKGKTDALRLFALAPVPDESGIDFEAYQVAFALLESDPTAAREAFAQLATQVPLDGLANFHKSRLDDGETGQRIVLAEK